MGKLFLLPCLVLLTAATPANSAPPTVASQIAAPSDAQQTVTQSGGRAATAVEEKKICKALPETGTRVAKRACLTATEWKQLEAELEQ